MVRLNKTTILLLLYFTTFYLYPQAEINTNNLAKSNSPKVVNGLIDLSDWSFEQNGSIELNGDWEFYWNQLLTPEDFINPIPPSMTAFMTVPQNWKNFLVDGEPLGVKGYATFRMQISAVNPYAEIIALQIEKMDTAYKLWINGKVLAGNGIVGTDAATSVPMLNREIISLNPDAVTFELVVQISNFSYKKGGFRKPIILGTKDKLSHNRDLFFFIDIFLFGSILFMGLYHFILYIFRRNDASSLFFGFLCLLIVIRVLVTSEKLILSFFQVPWELLIKLDFITFYLGVPVFLIFLFSLFPDETQKRIVQLFVGIGLLFSITAVFTKPIFFTSNSSFYQVIILISSLYAFIIIVKSLRKKREGVFLLFLGSLILFAFMINDVLHSNQRIDTDNLFPIGLYLFLFLQSVMISKRFSNAFTHVEILSNIFEKFVPTQFIKRIGKDGIHTIKLGNVETGVVSILFCDICSFTTMAEKMKPDEVFKFLNSYLGYMQPPISNNGGFIDKFIGDAIMALFDAEENQCQKTVMAAVEMQKVLKKYNKYRSSLNYQSIAIRIGIHHGNVIIGTVGSSERMDSTAIGDSVNLASRLEGLNSLYGTSILISDTVFNNLADPSQFCIRKIGRVMVKGKTQAVTIYEIFDEDLLEIKNKKIKYHHQYQKALELFTEGHFQEALTIFRNYIKDFPEDTAALFYISQSIHPQWDKNEARWDGVTKINIKKME